MTKIKKEQIKDFDIEVSNNQDVKDNTQSRHDHSNKTTLDAIEEAYTTDDKNKLANAFDKTVDTTDNITEGSTNKFNATHTGEITGSITLTLDKTAITNRTAVTPADDDYVLISDTSDEGNLKKVLKSDLSGGSSEVKLPLLNITIPRSYANYYVNLTGFVKKQDYVYILSDTGGEEIQRYYIDNNTKQIIYDNGADSNYWYYYNGTYIRNITSMSENNDYIYYTTSNANEIRRIDISTKTEIALTVNGDIAAYSVIASDNEYLYLFQPDTNEVKKFVVDNDNATATYIDTITLSQTLKSSIYTQMGALIYNNYIYYRDVNNYLVKDDINGNNIWIRKSYDTTSDSYGFGTAGVFFEWNDYIMYAYVSSADSYTQFILQVIETV